jgi:hypothetical protein
MTSHDDLIDRYIAAWNELDPQRRKEIIVRTWTEDSTYLDPMVQGAGRSGIDAMIDGVQKQFAGLKFRRAGAVDAHHDCLRFGWELAPLQGPAVAGGIDFGITRDGLLRKITGFIDFAPTTSAQEAQ